MPDAHEKDGALPQPIVDMVEALVPELLTIADPEYVMEDLCVSGATILAGSTSRMLNSAAFLLKLNHPE